MRKYKKLGAVFMVLLGVCACNSSDKTLNLEPESNPEEEIPDEVKGHLDVYQSMTRAVKYNINTAKHHIKEKIDKISPKATAQSLIDDILQGKQKQDLLLSDALRVLDFSVVLAGYRLEICEKECDDYLVATAAKQLAMAAIKAHKDALFGVKKIRQLDRERKQELKILEKMTAELKQRGVLAPETIEYKKGLEVALLEQNKLRSTMLAQVSQYARLVYADNKKLALEGRYFYELEDFDKKYNLELFQKVALEHRYELVRLPQNMKVYDLVTMKNHLKRRYPELEHLALNGYDIDDSLYAEELILRALKVAEDLLISTLDYSKVQEKEKQPSSDMIKDLETAILTQVDVAFNLVRQTSLDLQALKIQIEQKKQEIRKQKHISRPQVADKLKLINLKNAYLSLELQESQMLAERALALRSLYFYAGFSPFTQFLLEQNETIFNDNLKIAFNRDLVKMLSVSPKTEDKKWEVRDEDWSKGENWLEHLEDHKFSLASQKEVVLDPRPLVRKEHPKPEFVVMETDLKSMPNKIIDVPEIKKHDVNHKRILQLGSYQDKNNATLEWKMLQQLYPELQQFSPLVKRVRVQGKTWYRLLVKSETKDWSELCRKLKRDHFGCLLRE